MKEIQLNCSSCKSFYDEKSYHDMKVKVIQSMKTLEEKNGQGNEYTGWHEPERMMQYMDEIKTCAVNIRKKADVLIVVGIGGSFLGAKSVIDALKEKNDGEHKTEVLFVGNNISGSYTKKIIDSIKDKEVAINVISKSGTTTEPAITFRLLRKFMEDKYKDDAKNRIYATTDANKGVLRDIAQSNGYQTFVIPDDIGGRYSIFTPAGLLPIAVAGFDIDQFLKGAMDGHDAYLNDPDSGPVEYATLRNVFYQKGKNIEIMANYHPQLFYLTEWWKQLYGESEGKEGKGIFPAGVTMTTDLHSMGQYIQQGHRILFETVLHVQNMYDDICVPHIDDDDDQLNYLAGKSMNEINEKAMKATIDAHTSGEVPNIIIDIPEMTEYYLGRLMYFFMKACGLSGYTLGVNPFDQPGVEEYKKNMFQLLGRQGY